MAVFEADEEGNVHTIVTGFSGGTPLALVLQREQYLGELRRRYERRGGTRFDELMSIRQKGSQ